MHTKPHNDIQSESWIIRALPQKLRPYALLARLDRPIGIWLLWLPSLWVFALPQAQHSPNIALYSILFGLGSILMRSAGCIINDIWDRDLDKHVERTANRPIASGAISVKQALAFLALLLTLSLVILLQFNQATQILGLISLPFIVAYPLMKRITWWPQAFLGLTFNFSALMAYSAIFGQLTPTALMIYGAGILWTLAYDTIYAHQDIDDDAMIGIKSSARALGQYSTYFVYICYGASWALSLAVVGKPYILSLLPAGIYALLLCRIWQPDNKQSALDIFKSSKIYGLLILAGYISAQFYIPS